MSRRVDELVAETVGVGAAKDDELVREAEQRGYVIHKPQPPQRVAQLDLARMRGKRVRIGVISDTHFGSKFQQPYLLNQHVKYMKRRGVEGIVFAGDVTDGSTKMHPGFEYELWALGADAQKEAAIEQIPDLGIHKWVIAGNHDASHYKAAGVDVVAAICRERPDMEYLSPEQNTANRRGSIGYVTFGSLLMQVCHPHLGGTRQRSYRLETWIENQNPPKPNLVIMGNFHKVVQIDYRNVYGLLVPSFQDQTAWMASKAIESMVGSCILEFGYETKGLAPAITVEWLMERVPRANDFPGA